MAGAIPTLGYPSRTEAVLALRRQGLSITDIAGRIGIPAQHAGALLSSAKRTARYRVKVDRVDLITSAVSRGMIERLKPHAELRRCDVGRLIERILETVVEQDLVDAVLDDMAEA